MPAKIFSEALKFKVIAQGAEDRIMAWRYGMIRLLTLHDWMKGIGALFCPARADKLESYPSLAIAYRYSTEPNGTSTGPIPFSTD